MQGRQLVWVAKLSASSIFNSACSCRCSNGSNSHSAAGASRASTVPLAKASASPPSSYQGSQKQAGPARHEQRACSRCIWPGLLLQVREMQHMHQHQRCVSLPAPLAATSASSTSGQASSCASGKGSTCHQGPAIACAEQALCTTRHQAARDWGAPKARLNMRTASHVQARNKGTFLNSHSTGVQGVINSEVSSSLSLARQCNTSPSAVSP